MANSLANEVDVEALYDMFDPKYKANPNLARPFASVAINKPKSSPKPEKVYYRPDGLDNDTSFQSCASLEAEIRAKPNLELIATAVAGICPNYSNENAEFAFGRDGYMVEYHNSSMNMSMFNVSGTNSLDTNQLDNTADNEKSEPQVQFGNYATKAQMPDKKKKNIFKSLSQKKVRNLAMQNILENQKSDADKIPDNDSPKNAKSDINKIYPRVVQENPGNSYSNLFRIGNQSRSNDRKLNIIDTIDLTESDKNSVILADKTTVNKSVKKNNRNDIYFNMNSSAVPEINSNQKVMCWLNANSNELSDYTNQLSSIPEETNRPQKYVPTPQVQQMYEEMMKNRNINPPNPTDPSTNAILSKTYPIVDFIKTKR